MSGPMPGIHSLVMEPDHPTQKTHAIIMLGDRYVGFKCRVIPRGEFEINGMDARLPPLLT